MPDAVNNVIASIFAFTTSHQLLSIIIGLVLLLSTSGLVVTTTFEKLGIQLSQTDSEDRLYGVIFGKCENVIIYILVLLEGYTALALIFTGKAIVRNEDKEKLSVFHLAGTMINTAYSITIAFLVKYLIGKLAVFK